MLSTGGKLSSGGISQGWEAGMLEEKMESLNFISCLCIFVTLSAWKSGPPSARWPWSGVFIPFKVEFYYLKISGDKQVKMWLKPGLPLTPWPWASCLSSPWLSFFSVSLDLLPLPAVDSAVVWPVHASESPCHAKLHTKGHRAYLLLLYSRN